MNNSVDKLSPVSVENLIACGLSPAQAEYFVAQFPSAATVHEEALRWQRLTAEFLTPSIPFAVHEWLFHHNYPLHRHQKLPCPAWIPHDREVSATHLAHWFGELGLPDYAALHHWSITHRDAYAARLSRALAVVFRHPPAHFCDVSHGVAQARWFSGARLNIVESCFQADDNSPALLWDDAEVGLRLYTYAQLKALTARVANGLFEFGVEPGERVAIAMPMIPEAVAAYLGIVAAGCSAVTIADSFSANEIGVRLDITQPKCIFTRDVVERSGKSHPLFEKVATCSALPAIVVRTHSGNAIALRPGDKNWNEFLSNDTSLRCVSGNAEQETTVLFSSGTTGQPKAIPWDHTTPLKCAADAYFHQDVHSSDVVCWPTNMGWMMGPWLVYATLINRATMALTDAVPTGKAFCEFVQRSGVTILGVVPSIVSEWRKHDSPTDLDWSAIRLFSSTGECSNPSDMLWLMSRAGYRPIIEYCGGTEVGGGYVAGSLTKAAVPSAFSAKAMGFAWILLNDIHERSSLGEVFFEPPSIGMSTRLLNRDHHEVYYAEIPPGPQQQVLRRHGDQLEELTGGYFRAHGRVDDAMNLGGIKVSCIQIEELLQRHPAVRELAAISAPPPGGGPEQLIVFVVLQENISKSQLLNEMQYRVRHCLNPLFKIRAIEVIDKLPRTASNKVMRRELRNLFLTRTQHTN